MDIGFISAPPIETKKKHDRLLPFSSSLNYGLLSLASHLNNYGFCSKVFDPRIWEKEETIKNVLKWIQCNQPEYLGISCISGFSYPALKILSREIKKSFPYIPIIAGGKDHIALIANRAIIECPEIDVIVLGEGELPLLNILKSGFSRSSMESLERIDHIVFNGQKNNQSIAPKKTVNIEHLPSFNFNLYENYHQHPPCIEVGRGCPYKCSFCTNDRQKILKKSPDEIISEAKQLSSIYNSNELFLYFQTPMFLMDNSELETLNYLRDKHNLGFTWRMQTRVDYLSSENLNLIYRGGGRVIDVGLESGSEEMLVAMNKTLNPAEYLSKASEVMLSAHKENITLKLNLLFYVGERHETLLETFMFLDKHADLGWSISAYPLLIYPGTLLENSIIPLLKKHGGSKVCDPKWKERDLVPINPSSEFNYEEMQQLGVLFGKAFQTSEVYFKERRYGYFRPNVTFEEFQAHIGNIGNEDLPCSKDKEDMLLHREVLKSILDKNYANSANWS